MEESQNSPTYEFLTLMDDRDIPESPTAYLLDNVYPTLTDALTELAVKKPEDPVVSSPSIDLTCSSGWVTGS
jgi:hypothetical protein